MMEDKKLKDLPPSYTNLGYDADPVAGPSAPKTESDPAPDAYDVPGPSNAPQPSAPFPDLNTPGPRTLAQNPPSLVFENIYEACVRHADNHCCYGKRFVNQMKLTEIHNRTVYHYRLESYGEKRESASRSSPYRGGPVDGPENGRPPDPWDMTVLPPVPFRDGSTKRRIPHTESVHQCSECDGEGKVRCSSCYGSGEVDCIHCSGTGRVGDDDDTCWRCRGSKRQSCWSCSGTGKRTCSTCDGHGKVMKYRILIVTWKNHPTDSVTSTDQLPSELILKAQGVELLRETANELQPITNAAEPVVNSNSSRSLQAHKISFHNELIIKQKHVLRAIPFTRVKYKWKEREGEFYVYGADEKVYFEDYPQKCCCCTCC